jgi:transcriptional regulator with XRE-family HTH domain
VSDSKRLRHLIDARGLTLTKVAQAVPVALSTVSCWVSGAREPRGEDLRRFAQVLGLSEPELLDLLPRRDRRVTRSVTLPERTWLDLSTLATAAGRSLDDVAADLLSALFPGSSAHRPGHLDLELPAATWSALEVLAEPLGVAPEELCRRLLGAAVSALSAVEGPERAFLEALMVAGDGRGRARP